MPDSRAMASILDSVHAGEMAGAREGDVSTLNDAEAANLAFIVSDRFARDSRLQISTDEAGGDGSIAELALKVSQRLGDLALRLSDERSSAILGEEK